MFKEHRQQMSLHALQGEQTLHINISHLLGITTVFKCEQYNDSGAGTLIYFISVQIHLYTQYDIKKIAYTT